VSGSDTCDLAEREGFEPPGTGAPVLSTFRSEAREPCRHELGYCAPKLDFYGGSRIWGCFDTANQRPLQFLPRRSNLPIARVSSEIGGRGVWECTAGVDGTDGDS